MQDKILQIVIKAKDEASKTLNGLSDSLKKNEQGFRNMATAGTVGLGAIATLVGTSVKAFAEAEVANKRLDTIAKQVTKSTEAEIQGFKDLATALQRVGVVEDDVIIAGQSQIASFTKDGKVVTGLSDDLADLAVAQYGTNVSQEQAIETANLMGRALSGNLGALTRTGILVSGEFRTAFESANTEQERAVILSQIIQDNYGGLNKAMRDTAEGGMQVLKNSFGDMQETLGATFIPILNELVQKIIPVVDSIALWVQQNPELTRNIILASLAIAGLVAGIGFLGLILPSIIAGFGFLSVPVLLITGIIVALGIAVTNVTKIMLLFQNESKFIWDGIKIIFQEAIDGLVKFFEPLFAVIEKVKNAMPSIADGVKNTVSSVVKKVTGKATGGGVQVGQSYLVGEKGPEMFTPASTGSIIPNYKMASGGGMNLTINMNGGTYLDERVAEKIGDKIIQQFKSVVRF